MDDLGAAMQKADEPWLMIAKSSRLGLIAKLTMRPESMWSAQAGGPRQKENKQARETRKRSGRCRGLSRAIPPKPRTAAMTQDRKQKIMKHDESSR